MNDRRRDAAFVLLLVIGAATLANGLWMLADAARWFGKIAAVTGALNPHFVRDVGAAYVTVGVALLWAAFREAYRPPLVTVAAIFLGLHAADHAVETLLGALPPDHWIEDAPGVYLPALLVIALSARFLRARRI